MTPETVLIADDEPAVRDRLGAAFKSAGYSVLVASNGVEAWRILTENPTSVVACVVDLQMPPGKAGGLDLVVRIRNSLSDKLPIAVFSGTGTISSSHEITKAGANAFVEKESGEQAIVSAIVSLIASSGKVISLKESPLHEFTSQADLPWVAFKSFKNVEAALRRVLQRFPDPQSVHATLSKKSQYATPQLLAKLCHLKTFVDEKGLSLGDIFDIVIGLSAAQVGVPLSPTDLRTFKGRIVQTRNDQEHGRKVQVRTLLIALMAADELTEQLAQLYG